MTENQYHLNTATDVHSAPASELKRFIEHPENSLRLGDADFYATDIARRTQRVTKVTGNIPVGPEGSLDVEALVYMPTKAHKVASRILGREPHGNVSLTYFKGPNRH
ncbi:MAG TPA: hypothetical protein VLE69_00520 [Candidatus Saccharimonadales bacterium]|nr:hypothetical protein [Candidatus Saccharimonadales bacterium]